MVKINLALHIYMHLEFMAMHYALILIHVMIILTGNHNSALGVILNMYDNINSGFVQQFPYSGECLYLISLSNHMRDWILQKKHVICIVPEVQQFFC